MSLPAQPPKSLSDLQQTLSYLFEPTPILLAKLVPAIHAAGVPETYTSLVDLCARTVADWPYADKALFLSGHPAIGETKNLSASSDAEQSGTGATPTPRIVLDRYESTPVGRETLTLARLAHLNRLYEQQYPTLRYLIFVNGRSRQEIVSLLETQLGLPPGPVPLTEASRDAVETPSEPLRIVELESEEWRREADRGTADVWLIARDRLKKANLD